MLNWLVYYLLLAGFTLPGCLLARASFPGGGSRLPGGRGGVRLLASRLRRGRLALPLAPVLVADLLARPLAPSLLLYLPRRVRPGAAISQGARRLGPGPRR